MNLFRNNVAMILAGLCAFVISSSAEKKPVAEKPLQKIDMRFRGLPFLALGLTKGPADIEREDKRSLHYGIHDPHDVAIVESWDDRTKMLFTSPDTLVIYATRSKGESGRFLKAVFLGAKTGAVKQIMEWPVAVRKRSNELLDSEARIFAFDNGKFLVHANRKLKLYSGDFQLMAERELIGGPEDFWAVDIPPDSRSFCLRHESNGVVSCTWFDAATMKPASTPSASESFTTWVSTGGVKYYQDGRSESVFANGKRSNDVELRLKGDRQFFLDSSGFLITRHGQTEWEEKGSIDSPMSAAVVSSKGGDRFALTLFDKGGTFASIRLKMDTETLVFDIPSQSVVFHLPLEMYWDYECTLSPDGKLFAEVHDFRVSIYALPEPKSLPGAPDKL